MKLILNIYILIWLKFYQKSNTLKYVYTVLHTVCPRSSDPFYIVTYYIKLVITSWTDNSSNHVLTYSECRYIIWKFDLLHSSKVCDAYLKRSVYFQYADLVSLMFNKDPFYSKGTQYMGNFVSGFWIVIFRNHNPDPDHNPGLCGWQRTSDTKNMETKKKYSFNNILNIILCSRYRALDLNLAKKGDPQPFFVGFLWPATGEEGGPGKPAGPLGRQEAGQGGRNPCQGAAGRSFLRVMIWQRRSSFNFVFILNL